MTASFYAGELSKVGSMQVHTWAGGYVTEPRLLILLLHTYPWISSTHSTQNAPHFNSSYTIGLIQLGEVIV